MKYLITLIAGIALGIGGYLYVSHTEMPALKGSSDLGVCTPTQSTITIGNQQSKQLLATSTSRQWAVIQQPLNATNTVSLALSNNATAGAGILLANASTTNTDSKLSVGFATDFRTDRAVNAITSTGSTTINVTDCK